MNKKYLKILIVSKKKKIYEVEIIIPFFKILLQYNTIAEFIVPPKYAINNSTTELKLQNHKYFRLFV